MEKPCSNCDLPLPRCICAQVDKFFKDNRELMDDLARAEELELLDQEQLNALSRDQDTEQCLACFFAPCRCKAGLRNKP